MPENNSNVDVVGTLDGNNNIILTGNLAVGTYTLKYENTDNTYSEIGILQVETIPETETIINLIPISTNTDGSLFVGTNGELGYITDTRLSVGGATKTQTNHETTGFIPIDYSGTIYVKNIVLTDATTEIICFYDSNYNVLLGSYINYVFNTTNGEVVSKKVSEIALDAITENKDNIAFFRISANEITANSIITVNQPLL